LNQIENAKAPDERLSPGLSDQHQNLTH